MNVAQVIILCSHIPVLATVIIAAVRFSTLGKALRSFSWFIFLSGIIQFASLALWLARKNNMPLLHFYVASGFVCQVWYYKTILGELINRKIMWGLALVFLAFTLANSIFLQHPDKFNSNALLVQSVLVIILALFTFIFFLNNTIKEAGIPDMKSLTWVNSGLFIYYVSCLLIYYFSDMLVQHASNEVGRVTWMFHSFFSVVMYTCFFIALWKRTKTQHS